jgi:hypothetical protein
MSSLTNYGEKLALDLTTNALNDLPTPAGTRLVALYTTAPGETGLGGVEVSGGSYVRKPVTFGPAGISGPDTVASNTAEVLFDEATASWGNIVAMAIFDNAATPNMIWYGNLSAPKTVDVNDQIRFPIGSILLSIA